MLKLCVVLLGLVVYATADCGILERLKVKRQWSQAFGEGEQREEFGLKLWVDIFQNAPAARGLFARVHGDNEFSDEFAAHSQRVLSGLDMLISLMDDEAVMNAELAHLKSQHDGRSIAAENYQVFKTSLGHTLAKSLGRFFAKDAWDACFDVFVTGITG